MEDYMKQLLMQELQGQGENGDEVAQPTMSPTITPESKAGVGIASLINAIVGAKAMKGSGNAGLGALYGGASTYGEGMGNLQKAAAQAQANKSKEERIKSLIKNQIFKQNFDTVKYMEDRKAKEDKAEREDRAAQNYGDLLITPNEESETKSRILSDIARNNPEMAQKYQQATKEKDTSGNLNAIISATQEVGLDGKPTQKARDAQRVLGRIEQYHRNIRQPEGGLDFADKELVKKTMVELPKLKKDALSGKTNLTQIDRTLDLVKQGVTGKGGQIKAFLAPYAEAIGIDSRSLNDAQTFQLLTRAIIGPMRLEIVGPGPVSEWEQKLMQKISGGGGAAKDAAIELLSHWNKVAQEKVDNYNNTLEGFSEIYPNVKRVYQPIPTSKETSSGNLTPQQRNRLEELRRKDRRKKVGQ